MVGTLWPDKDERNANGMNHGYKGKNISRLCGCQLLCPFLESFYPFLDYARLVSEKTTVFSQKKA
jgi:hypothetical protein